MQRSSQQRKKTGRKGRKGRSRPPQARAREPGSARARPEASRGLARIALCFALSGFAALLYQTAWLRQFSIVFGTSEVAVATVLAAYMAGLAVGAAAAGRWLDRVTRPILVYGVLEAGIAVSALAVPFLIRLGGLLCRALLGDQAAPPDSQDLGQSLLYLVVSFSALALPTAFMGATLPLLIRHAVRTDAEVGPRVAFLYAINTAGAVVGTVAAGFFLLPRLGLTGTVWVGVATNFLVFAIAASLVRSLPQASVAHAPRAEDGAESEAVGSRAPGFLRSCIAPLLRPGSGEARRALRGQAAWILPLMCVSGAVAFLYEVLWTRLLSHVLGGTVYAFATMLASFLAGIALGGATAGRFASTREDAVRAFVLSQIAIAILSVFVYASLEGLLPEQRDLWSKVRFAGLVMLPSTLFIGATFPLAVRILTPSEKLAGACAARIYAWNTAGAIVGAVLAGFVLIPALGFAASIRLAVLVNVGLGLGAALLTARRPGAPAAAAAAVLLGLALLYHPTRPDAVIATSAVRAASDTNTGRPSREVYYGVGRSATVTMTEENGHFFLHTNGMPESTIEPRGALPVFHDQRWLTGLPLVARPDARSLLVVGFGGGVAVEEVPASVREIHVVELEPEVIAANRAIRAERRRDPLADPRLRVVLNDARNALALTSRRYDVIVSQPSHPWTAGASHLYTREFLALAREHLEPGGVFLQWIGAELVDAELLRSMVATLRETFTHVRLYQFHPAVINFVASDTPLEIESRLAATGRPLRDFPDTYARIGARVVEDVARSLLLDERAAAAFAGEARPITDDDNRLAFYSRTDGSGLDGPALVALLAPHDPLRSGRWAARAGEGPVLDSVYMASTLLNLGFKARVHELPRALLDRSESWLVSALIFVFEGREEAADDALRRALVIDPENRAARYLRVELHRDAVVSGEAPEDVLALTESLSGVPRAVVAGWRRAARDEWTALATLDAELARAQPTDLWYPAAATLRATSRVRAPSPNGRDSRAGEAVAILDRALVASRSPEILEVRLSATLAGRDAPGTLETARGLAALLKDRLDRQDLGAYALSSEEARALLAGSVAARQALGSELLRQLPGERVADVRDQLEELEGRLEALAEGAPDAVPRTSGMGSRDR